MDGIGIGSAGSVRAARLHAIFFPAQQVVEAVVENEHADAVQDIGDAVHNEVLVEGEEAAGVRFLTRRVLMPGRREMTWLVPWSSQSSSAKAFRATCGWRSQSPMKRSIVDATGEGVLVQHVARTMETAGHCGGSEEVELSKQES